MNRNENRLPNVHIQRASGDSTKEPYKIYIDRKQEKVINNGNYADLFVDRGKHEIKITGPDLDPASFEFVIENEKEKITFFTRSTFGKIEIIKISN